MLLCAPNIAYRPYSNQIKLLFAVKKTHSPNYNSLSQHLLLLASGLCAIGETALSLLRCGFRCPNVPPLRSPSGGSKNQNSRNPPKFTKSSVYINQIPPSATKSTYMKRKLSTSNVSSHKINGFHKIQ